MTISETSSSLDTLEQTLLSGPRKQSPVEFHKLVTVLLVSCPTVVGQLSIGDWLQELPPALPPFKLYSLKTSMLVDAVAAYFRQTCSEIKSWRCAILKRGAPLVKKCWIGSGEYCTAQLVDCVAAKSRINNAWQCRYKVRVCTHITFGALLGLRIIRQTSQHTTTKSISKSDFLRLMPCHIHSD